MIIKRNINFYRPDDENGYWERYEDCSARDAAIASATQLVDEAQIKYDKAVDLINKLNKEHSGISDAIGDYDQIYKALEEAGSVYLTKNNIDSINYGASCLTTYKENLEETRRNALRERSKCLIDLNNAKKELNKAKGMGCAVSWKYKPYY